MTFAFEVSGCFFTRFVTVARSPSPVRPARDVAGDRSLLLVVTPSIFLKPRETCDDHSVVHDVGSTCGSARGVRFRAGHYAFLARYGSLMSAVHEYRDAQKRGADARLSRVIALRAMLSSGKSQCEVAAILGISQSAVSQQLRSAPEMESVPADVLLVAATPVLRSLASEHNYGRLAVFGSVARGTTHAGSDIDLIVDAPPGTSSFEFIKIQESD